MTVEEIITWGALLIAVVAVVIFWIKNLNKFFK